MRNRLTRPGPLPALAASTSAAAVLVALIFLARLREDWDVSEGVYALTARALLDGQDLYGQVVVAQPPGMFLLATPVLWIADDLDVLRAVVALGSVVAALLMGVIAWRLTRSRAVAAATPVAAVLTPWTVHQQGLLTAETVALPFLAGAVLLAGRRGTSAWAGVLAGVLVLVKLPLVLPALAIVLFAAGRRPAVVAFVATTVVLLGGSLLVFGPGLWDDAVLAQLQVGRHTAGIVVRLGVQVAWNLLPLLGGCALLALARRRGWRTTDAAQLRVLVAAAVGTALTLASITKEGTSLSVLPPVELVLATLAVPGVAAAWSTAAGPGVRRPGPRAVRAIGLVLALLLVAQPVSLLLSPRDGGALFRRPFSAPAYGVGLTRGETDAAVAAARRCPAGFAYAGPPTVAFRAHRDPPAGQPDDFLTLNAKRLRGVRATMDADTQRCPVAPVGG